eukprot:m.111060 g.111060  ORF g.111060 m.111060 type:complete len:76 (+) comp28087_c0_seq1:141-368(+)
MIQNSTTHTHVNTYSHQRGLKYMTGPMSPIHPHLHLVPNLHLVLVLFPRNRPTNNESIITNTTRNKATSNKDVQT